MAEQKARVVVKDIEYLHPSTADNIHYARKWMVAKGFLDWQNLSILQISGWVRLCWRMMKLTFKQRVRRLQIQCEFIGR